MSCNFSSSIDIHLQRRETFFDKFLVCLSVSLTVCHTCLTLIHVLVLLLEWICHREREESVCYQSTSLSLSLNLSRIYMVFKIKLFNFVVSFVCFRWVQTQQQLISETRAITVSGFKTCMATTGIYSYLSDTWLGRPTASIYYTRNSHLWLFHYYYSNSLWEEICWENSLGYWN